MPPVVDEKKDVVEKSEAASASKAAATEGAQSVADAVRRVADAAVAEVQKATPQVAQAFSFTGTPGGRFTIRGTGFSSSGTVRIGGTQAFTREWGNEYIGGQVPDGAKAGLVTVEIIIDKDTRQSGTFRI